MTTQPTDLSELVAHDPIAPRLLLRTAEVDVRVPDPDSTASFLCDVLDFVDLGLHDGARHVGLESDYGTAGVTRVFTIRAGPSPMLAGITYEVPTGGLEVFRDHLDRTGAQLVEFDGAGLRVLDNNQLPITCAEASTSAAPAVVPSPIRPRRFGHVTMKVPDGLGTARWYVDHLGFRFSEIVEGRMHFLRLGAEHHRLAIGGGGTVVEAQHFAFEVPGWDYYRTLLDHLVAHGHTVEYGPGRHAPGRNIFVYLKDPASKLRLELYCDMAQVDNEETYEVKIWRGEEQTRTVNQWGPLPPSSFRDD